MKNGRYEEQNGIYWYKNDQVHREDGPAFERSDGSLFWFFNGLPHREDGPATEWSDGSKKWSINGFFHRENGPAIELIDGTKKWYLNGIEYTEEEFQQLLDKKNLNEKLETTLEPKPKEKKKKI